jgi:hypothetical protein
MSDAMLGCANLYFTGLLAALLTWLSHWWPGRWLLMLVLVLVLLELVRQISHLESRNNMLSEAHHFTYKMCSDANRMAEQSLFLHMLTATTTTTTRTQPPLPAVEPRHTRSRARAALRNAQ